MVVSKPDPRQQGGEDRQQHGLANLPSLFTESHPVLGALVKLERCQECVRLRAVYARAQRAFDEHRLAMAGNAETMHD